MLRFSLILLSVFIMLFTVASSANAICCMPLNMHGYRDPDTGQFVGIGEFWNDHPFWYPLSNITLQFQFLDENKSLLYEKEQRITHTLPINSGFIIPPGTTLPFKIVLDDPELSMNAKYFGERGTIHFDRAFKWKPADLIVSFNNIEVIKSSPDLGYKKWAVQGSVLNNYTRSTQHVYVIAGIYQGYNLTGVAGYSPNDKQPLELDGFETKNFTLYATIPYEIQPDRVYLYAESEDSSMKYPYSFPINGEHKIRGTSITSPHISVGAKITFSSNMTSISRHDHDFYWILQIKKLPEEDVIELPAIVHRGVTEHIEVIPASLAALDSIRIEFPWSPSSKGLYAYQIYVWDDLETPAPLALLSVTSFHDDHLIWVS